jgi:hypothetical protein
MVVSFAGSVVVLLPVPVQEWIMDFDWGVQVDPMEFELVLPGASEHSGPSSQPTLASKSDCRRSSGSAGPVPRRLRLAVEQRWAPMSYALREESGHGSRDTSLVGWL